MKILWHVQVCSFATYEVFIRFLVHIANGVTWQVSYRLRLGSVFISPLRQTRGILLRLCEALGCIVLGDLNMRRHDFRHLSPAELSPLVAQGSDVRQAQFFLLEMAIRYAINETLEFVVIHCQRAAIEIVLKDVIFSQGNLCIALLIHAFTNLGQVESLRLFLRSDGDFWDFGAVYNSRVLLDLVVDLYLLLLLQNFSAPAAAARSAELSKVL